MGNRWQHRIWLSAFLPYSSCHVQTYETKDQKENREEKESYNDQLFCIQTQRALEKKGKLKGLLFFAKGIVSDQLLFRQTKHE